MMKNKRGLGAIGWIIIISILIAIGVGIYFWLFGGGDASSILGGSGVPSPPPLPS